MNIRAASEDDLEQVLSLYCRVAANPGGIARLEHEVSASYVQNFLYQSIADGIMLVGIGESGEVVAEIHAYSPGPYCFSHVLTELTVVVNPRAQGNGFGRSIFGEFLRLIEHTRSDILRVELIARESNAGAISFYKSLGFSIEGALRSRIKNLDGSIESDIPMAWVRQDQDA